MKIFQFIFALGSGGAEKFTVDLSNELSKSNEVYVCVIIKEDKESSLYKDQLSDRLHYINLGCSKGVNFKTFISIFKILNKIKPDVVHAHLNTKLYLYLPSLIFKDRIKFVHTIHNLADKDCGYQWQKKNK